MKINVILDEVSVEMDTSDLERVSELIREITEEMEDGPVSEIQDVNIQVGDHSDLNAILTGNSSGIKLSTLELAIFLKCDIQSMRHWFEALENEIVAQVTSLPYLLRCWCLRLELVNTYVPILENFWDEHNDQVTVFDPNMVIDDIPEDLDTKLPLVIADDQMPHRLYDTGIKHFNCVIAWNISRHPAWLSCIPEIGTLIVAGLHDELYTQPLLASERVIFAENACVRKIRGIWSGVNYHYKKICYLDLDLPLGLIELQNGALRKLGLNSVTFPDTLTIIDDSVMRDTYGKFSVRIPDSVKKIGTAFLYGSEVSEIVLGSSLYIVGDNFLEDCVNIGRVDIPPSLTRAGHMFLSQTSITEIDLLNIEFIGEHLFNSCKKLRNVIYSRLCETIPSYAFSDIPSLESIIFPPNSRVKTIGDWAFSKSTIEAFDMPDTVTSIGKSFMAESHIGRLHLSQSLVDMDENFLSSASRIERIAIPSKVRTIMPDFMTKSSVKFVNFEAKKMHAIWDNFLANSKVVRLELPNYYVYMLGRAFCKGSDIEEIQMPGHVGVIGPQFLEDCKSISKIVIPSAGSIACGFMGSSSIRSVTITSLENIPEYFLCGCNCLEHLILPEDCETVGDSFVTGAGMLAELRLPPRLKSIGTDFLVGSGLKTIYIPEGVVDIPQGFMKSSTKLISVRLSPRMKTADVTGLLKTAHQDLRFTASDWFFKRFPQASRKK